MDLIKTLILVCCHACIIAVDAQTVTLEMDSNIVQYSPAQLTATVDVPTQVTLYRITWFKDGSAVALILLPNCNAHTAPAVDRTTYDFSCNITTKLFTWTIKNATQNNQGDVWSCQVITDDFSAGDNGLLTSNTLYLYVLVPITSVSLTSPSQDSVTVTENIVAQIRCETAAGIPQATVQWHKDNATPGTEADDILIPDSDSSTVYDSNTYITASTLNLRPSRNDHNMEIYCKARNINASSWLTSSRKLQLIVQYASDPPVIIGFTNNSDYYMIRNKSQTLTCSVAGGRPQPQLYWSCYNGQEGGPVTDGATLSSTITWTSTGPEDQCSCTSTQTGFGTSSTRVNVIVQYVPVVQYFEIGSLATTVSRSDKIRAFNTLNAKCIGSGRPSPSYTWTLPGSTSVSGQTLNTAVSDSGGGSYTCRARNIMKESLQGGGTRDTSAEDQAPVTVLVQTEPATPTIYCNSTAGSIIQSQFLMVAASDNVILTCSSSGIPPPESTWQGTSSSVLTLSPIAEAQNNTQKACTASSTIEPTGENPVTRSKSATLNMRVTVPAELPITRYKNNAGNYVQTPSTLLVIRGRSATLVCESRGVPVPQYTWTLTSSSTSSGPTLNLSPVSDASQGTYTCTAFNTIERTCGQRETHRKHSQLSLSVLSSATVETMPNRTIIENELFTYLCPYQDGKPTATVKWTFIKTSTTVSTNASLHVSTGRESMGYFKCTTKSTLNPTGYSVEEIESSQTFYLDIYYKTAITSFVVNGFDGSQARTFDEQQLIMFSCDVDSNPGSNISIQKLQSSRKWEVQNDKNLVTQSLSAVCSDAGVYRCSGINPSANQGSPSTKEITVYVNCEPRRADEMQTNYTSVLGGNVTLEFNTLAYPVPTEYRWQRYNGQGFVDVSGDRFNVVSSELHTTLTVLTVHSEDFVAYKLTITNGIGDPFQEVFYITHHGHPGPPIYFSVADGSISETTVTLVWAKGYNGGLPQTFVIQYRKSGLNTWSDLKIEETENTIMSTTLRNLESDKQYMVQIYAYNKIGESDGNPNVTFSTLKGIEEEDGRSSNAAVIGAGVGVSTAVVVIIAIIGIIIVYRRRFRRDGCQQQNRPSTDRVYKDLNNIDTTDSYEAIEQTNTTDLSDDPSSEGKAAAYSSLAQYGNVQNMYDSLGPASATPAAGSRTTYANLAVSEF